jgi:hypothetical protein
MGQKWKRFEHSAPKVGPFYTGWYYQPVQKALAFGAQEPPPKKAFCTGW